MDSNAWLAAFTQLGATGIIVAWLTMRLIPQLQKERSDAIAAFQQEMEKERALHREMNAKLDLRNERLTEVLLQYFLKRNPFGVTAVAKADKEGSHE